MSCICEPSTRYHAFSNLSAGFFAGRAALIARAVIVIIRIDAAGLAVVVNPGLPGIVAAQVIAHLADIRAWIERRDHAAAIRPFPHADLEGNARRRSPRQLLGG